ncbi:nuclear transport factor 2 family protein [Skermania sp. ID1734]|uniref:nuclear transport factor 2 family protein n=1 Tax=Skermania sp. ID1734 TaxID=2597516 RepID=UPI00117D194F|nr:nuclear transport factor 2 family protein [Skermania sp. ID1734]TSD99642.1 nuclear transport factor 2 family protein [Skermania sp. ID1734]
MHKFRTAVETRGFEDIGELFAEDVVFHSPIAHKPYQGRETLTWILRAVSKIFEDFEYEREIGSEAEGDAALVFRARVGELTIEGCDFLHTNSEGLIDDFTVMLRPLKAVHAFEARMRVEFEAVMKEMAGEG